MGRVRTIARRTFLIGSAAILGGVAFGNYAVRRPHANPLATDLAEGAATFNPWVLIDGQAVTLITPHADKGQGVASAQAALIAEELDIEFGQFRISFGQPSPAYWNTAMAEDAVPFRPTDESLVAEAMRSVMGGVMKLLGVQGTGGSTAMADSFDKLRLAGATARETLKLAASQQSGVPVEQLETARGAVQLPDGSELKYTELAAQAATIEPVSDVPLRDPSTWRLIGKPMERTDILGKSTGTLDYGIDVRVPGMVHATVCTNPRTGGVMNGYDASEALTMRGVKDVVEVTSGVAVIADNTWRAIRAMETIQFDWGPAPYPAEQADHWATIEASFSDDHLDSQWRDDGDAETALASGATFEAEYRSPYVAHAPMEPLNAIVLVTDDAVEVWTGHQLQGLLLMEISKITGHPTDQITLHNQYIGGSFGHRLEFEHVKQAAEVANQMRGTPVKLTYSREEDFAQDFPRHISIGRGRGKVEDGKVVAVDLSIAAPSVVGSQMGRVGLTVPGPDAQIAAGAWNNPYSIPNFRMRAYRAPELAPTSSWRAVGAPAAGFYFDSLLDELIHEAGADPMEERIRLMEHDVSRKVLETAAELCSWGSELRPNQGRGVAFVESFGVPVCEVVEVTNTEDGIRLDKVWAVCDVGTIVDPVNFENLVQGGVVFGLGHAINCEITFAGGIAEQSNYHAHEAMRMYQCPEIIVKGLENGHKVRGIGEPPVPPAAPALANAIFAATGQRLREMPFNKFIDFV
ncbi:MAG: molybdopterin-dependent oxidoreductase [Paracoccaceae bacterium]|nr:molybdopterin-dependent oxidoreductase [Paracoccaceae bacterium]